jgi:ATP-dependent Lon protease
MFRAFTRHGFRDARRQFALSPFGVTCSSRRLFWWDGKGDGGNDGKERKVHETADSSGLNTGSDDHGTGGNSIAVVGEGEDAPRPDCLLAIPLVRRPLFPHGQFHPLNTRDAPTRNELIKIAQSSVPYVGAFLYKEEFSADLEVANPLTDISLVHPVGTLAQVHLVPHRAALFQNTSNSDENFDNEEQMNILVRGQRRVQLLDVAKHTNDRLLYIKAKHLSTSPVVGVDEMNMVTATGNAVMEAMRDLVKINPSFREQLGFMYTRVDPKQEPGKFADFVASLLTSGPDELQHAFEAMNVKDRLDRVLMLLMKELEISKLQDKIKTEVEQKIQGEQRKYMLREQLKSIQKELGIKKGDKETVAAKFTDRMNALDDVPEAAKSVIDQELEKLDSLEPSSSEFNVTRNYLDWLTSIPWGKFSDENFEIEAGKAILEEDHYGMEDAKDRILEFIAVGKLKGSVQGKIICLAGPPGVGKTSIGKSIARALNREYYRFSVGGLSDVAEIKGHRRTYVGAMPGKIIQALKTTSSFNPLILIDEIDKLGRGHSGDPASALLELLDPSQNHSFVDHYLDVPLDLSRALFVCTANNLETIPGPLLDRMEVITLSGYDLPEKVQICEQYLEPKAREENGLTSGSPGVPQSLGLEREATESIIRWYCREAGVRNLQKQIEKMYRKLAYKIVKESPAENDPNWSVTEDKLEGLIGKRVFNSDRLYEEGTPPGTVMGLAYTTMGGSALYIETAGIASAGKAKKSGGAVQLKRTGQLGDVMNESSELALTLARQKLNEWNPSNTFFENSTIHLHVPEGAIKKDGPSAGVTMTTALLSLAMDRPIRGDLAMTGEISLNGKVLPVGGIKEKTIAARRAGVNCLILPADNKKDFEDLPEYIQEDLEVHFCEEYDEVFDIAFAEDRFFDL